MDKLSPLFIFQYSSSNFIMHLYKLELYELGNKETKQTKKKKRN